MSLDENYSIDLGSGNKRVLDFYDYEIAETKGLSSQPKFELFVKFKMNGNAKIKSNERPVTESDSLIVIDAACQLSLQTSNGRHITTINLYRQDDRKMYSGGYYFFNTFIHPKDAEDLMHIIKGESVRIGWRVNGYASANVKPHRAFPIMRFDVCNLTDDTNRWPQISADEFSSRILQRLGLNEKFLVEFPLQISPLLTTYSNLPLGIRGLIADLNTLVTNLKNAVNTLRNPRSTDDYRQVMDQVKTSLDSIRFYFKDQNNKENLAKEIFVNTGIISNIDPAGGDKAAEDVIEKFGNILENIYQISSKPAHTKPRPRQPQLRFNISPESSDAEFVLTLGLASAKYILKKIEAYINYNK